MGKILGLFVMDVDSTLVKEEVIDLLAQEAGFGKEVAQITELAMNGHLDFEAALKERVALLEGLPLSIFDKVYQSIHFNSGAQELVNQLHDQQYKVGLVSGGFHETVDRLADELGIDYVHANQLANKDGKLTGELEGPIVTKEVKLQKLQDWALENNLNLSQTVAMGDGANDLPMIKAAGIGIAFCAKPIVQNQALYQIDVPNLMEALTIINKERG
ncbi:phosphoserine phosphatase SerB [Streptococcus parauberis]|uniref:phosphoserine phosphatase n=3 Tax=Streptococcus parauberis TaxID=1348 RepID=A0A0E2UBX7_9STRE|nr:phosphoserine phosphatase SerB [Streptococcus parauberis]AEF24912.1 haloacid dehalogenase-like hydrolase [Streptococcus parauberis KCTC 11537]AUT05688.1 Phosphoserine phosphatase [Streptococcus parauberis]EGE54181.1 phosphoserine phosphatase SerB [Streptococcus parauberis NCFD 2020]EMF49492.1 Phosphoserine phosphatase [Streptococcus parauberis KRS-02109]EMG26228.1 Phosphoserine phosphatase [Streptococcus parauberis KRS-02083]